MTETTTTHEPGDTVTLASRMLFNDDQARQGIVTAIADNGRVTAEFPQDASFPLVVTFAAEHFVHVRKAPAPLGFIVLIFDCGSWKDNWDGDVHATLEAGETSLAEARRAGYTAVLTQAQPVGEVPDVSAEVGPVGGAAA